MPVSSETDLFDNFPDIDEWEESLCSTSSELDEILHNVQSPIWSSVVSISAGIAALPLYLTKLQTM